jgi:hypothetical protein
VLRTLLADERRRRSVVYRLIAVHPGPPPSSSLLDCLGRSHRVKAKPHAVASRALTHRLRPERWQLLRRTEEDQDTAVSPGRTAVRWAINAGDEGFHGHSRTPCSAGQAMRQARTVQIPKLIVLLQRMSRGSSHARRRTGREEGCRYLTISR